MADLKQIFSDRADTLTDHDPWRYGPALSLKADLIEISWVNSHMQGGTLLDVGCGTGRHCIELSKLHPNMQFDCFDFAPNNIKIFNKKIEKEHIVNIHAKICGTDEMLNEYGDKKFDNILGIGLVQYLDDEKHVKFLEESHRLLNDGGVLMLKNPISHLDSFVFDGYSELLQNRYVSRYRNLQDTARAVHTFFHIEKIEQVFTLKNLTEEELNGIEHNDTTRQMWFLLRKKAIPARPFKGVRKPSNR